MSMPYFRFFPGDYLRKTRRLSPLQHGIYMLLIMEYMSSGKPLRGDLPSICRICGAMSIEEQNAVEYVLAEFFTRRGAEWINDRCDDELRHQEERSEAARESVRRREAKKTASNDQPNDVTNDTSNDDRTINEGCIERSSNQNQNQNQNQSQNQSQNQNQTLTPIPASPRKKRAVSAGPPTGEVWLAYSTAYFGRYGTEPVRNRKVNALLSRLVERLGNKEAPSVAAHYVRSDNRLYLSSGHCVDLLLRDAEKLRTEWATGRNVTTTANPFTRILAKMEAGMADD